MAFLPLSRHAIDRALLSFGIEYDDATGGILGLRVLHEGGRAERVAGYQREYCECQIKLSDGRRFLSNEVINVRLAGDTRIVDLSALGLRMVREKARDEGGVLRDVVRVPPEFKSWWVRWRSRP
jgi:hypothetical protein